MFDFTNYTFSFVTTLVASILGITYPLLMESIRKIDEEYDSSTLVEHFQKEASFKLYRGALLPVVLVLVTSPFVMLAFGCELAEKLVICLLSTIVFGFVCNMVYLFYLILVYYTPNKLSEYLKWQIHKYHNDDECLICLLDLLFFSAKKYNYDLYSKNKDSLIYFLLFRRPITEYKVYNLPEKGRKNIERFFKRAIIEQNQIICNDDLIQHIFYNSIIKGYNGYENFRTIWRVLCNMIDADCTAWFMMYWNSAIEYYSTYIELGDAEFIDSAAGLNYKNSFIEFHTMLGAMLVQKEKYDLLNFILTKDCKKPAQYKLILGSFNDIINFVRKTEMYKNSFLFLTQQYQMQGYNSVLESDEQILEALYKYCALLTIRIFSYQDVNSHYQSALKMPEMPIDLMSLDELQRQTDKLLDVVVNYWYKDNLIKKIQLPKLADQSEVKALFDVLGKKMDLEKSYPRLNIERFRQWVRKIVLTDNEERTGESRQCENIDGFNCYKKSFVVYEQLNARISTSQYYEEGVTLLNFMQTQLSSYIASLYSKIKSLKEFSIYEYNIFNALDSLKLNENYCICSLGVDCSRLTMLIKEDKYRIERLGNGEYRAFFNNAPIYNLYSNLNCMLIIRKDDLHRVRYVKPELNSLGENMQVLNDSQYYICSDVNRIIEKNDVNGVVSLGRSVEVYLRDNLKCVKIKVKYDEAAIDDINEVDNLSKYLV